MSKLAKAINRFVNIVKNHKTIFRILCLIMSILSLTICIIAASFDIFHHTTSTHNLLFALSYFLLILSIIPTAIIEIENSFDKLLQFLLTIYSLLYVSGGIAFIIHSIFKNEQITIYFWVSSFFIFSYLYELVFKNSVTNEPNSKTNFNNIFFYNLEKVWGKSAGIIGYTCNIIRIVLLVLDVFNKQYDFGLDKWLLTEAIVTSLAFEKIIKTHSKKNSKNDNS